MASAQTTVIETSSAPREQNISTVHAYTHLHSFTFSTTTDFVRSFELSTLLQDHIVGWGRVDLVKMVVKFRTTAVDQTVEFGVCDSGSSLDAHAAAMKPNGYSHMSNARNYGEQAEIDLVPEDTLSTQIRPISAMLPSMKVLFSVSKGVKINLQVYYSVRGVCHLYSTLK